MRNVVLFIVAVTAAGCASTGRESAAEFQQDLPQLIAACNQFSEFEPDRGHTQACDRLALNRSLDLADRAARNAYLRRKNLSLAPPVGPLR